MAPIHHAASVGDAEKLRQLLESGESPDTLYHETAFYLTQTPLHCLCERNVGDRAACFELLRDAGANLEASDSERNRPLHYAAERGYLEFVSLLVQARVNVDATGNHGATALHLAARSSRRGAADCVEVLLSAGASVNARNDSGRTPFDIALSHNCRRAWPLFLRAGAEIPTDNTDPYIVRVRNAGGFQRYAQAHLARIASILETPLLPPELVRKVLEFWLHAGYY
jgi:ankyrin repeat protein